MAKTNPPSKISIITTPLPTIGTEYEEQLRTPEFRAANAVADVDILKLQGQVNLFLNQLNQVMQETPEKVGGFLLDEFEVSAGIVVEAKGEVKLALLANAEAGAGVNAGLRFVFKRAST